METVSHNPTGWPLREYDRGYPGIQRCRSVLARRTACLPPCDDVAVWKVEETTKGMVRTGYYCNADLPSKVAS
jgi:hypothetical protein